MANVRYSDLVCEVLPNLAADPSDPVTENAIKRAVIDFCAQSWIWRYTQDPIDVQAGEAACDLEPPPGAVVTAVASVRLNGMPLAPRTTDWLDENVPCWSTTPGTPLYYTADDPTQVILAPLPDSNAANGLVVALICQPSQASTSFPSWINERHIEALANGATARLMAMPSKPWTDLQNAAGRNMQFMQDIAAAKDAAVSGFGRAPLRVTGQH